MYIQDNPKADSVYEIAAQLIMITEAFQVIFKFFKVEDQFFPCQWNS